MNLSEVQTVVGRTPRALRRWSKLTASDYRLASAIIENSTSDIKLPCGLVCLLSADELKQEAALPDTTFWRCHRNLKELGVLISYDGGKEVFGTRLHFRGIYIPQELWAEIGYSPHDDVSPLDYVDGKKILAFSRRRA